MDSTVLIEPNVTEANILNRSSIINLLLAAAIGLVVLKTYEIWQQDDRRPLKRREETSQTSSGRGSALRSLRNQAPDTKVIVENDLFDEKRGAGGNGTQAAVTQDPSEIEGMVLLGTIVAAGKRYAIIKVPPSTQAGRGSNAGGGMRRLGLGETVWGYTLSEIQADRVIFTKGSTEVELGLDFSRRSSTTQQPANSKPSSKNRRRRR